MGGNDTPRLPILQEWFSTVFNSYETFRAAPIYFLGELARFCFATMMYLSALGDDGGQRGCLDFGCPPKRPLCKSRKTHLPPICTDRWTTEATV